MGIAILPSYLIGSDAKRGRLVRVLGDYKLPKVEINIGYPSRRHLPAKVRTFIDHLVDHFNQTPNGTLGELWLNGRQSLPFGPDSADIDEDDTDVGAQSFNGRHDSARHDSSISKMPKAAIPRVTTPA
jgi:hypothetical protein